MHFLTFSTDFIVPQRHYDGH